MKRVTLLLLLLALSSALTVSTVYAQCPWINKATVAGLYDVPSSSSALRDTETDVSCSFQLQDESGSYQIFIGVQEWMEQKSLLAAYGKNCASRAIPLRGIGNEAFLCRARSPHPYTTQVIGRVRGKVFIVQASSTSMESRYLVEERLGHQARITAEQVAGNLF